MTYILGVKREYALTGCVVGLAVLVVGAQFIAPTWPGVQQFFIAIFLMVTIVLSYHYPIGFRNRSKIQMSTVPLYVLVVLLTPAFAALAAAAGILVAELTVYTRRQNQPCDVAFQTARITIISLLASLFAHTPLFAATIMLGWISAAILLMASDFLTFGVQQFALFGEHPWPVIQACFRDVSVSEAAQYLLGLLGVIAASEASWTLLIMVAFMAIVYFSCKQAVEWKQKSGQILESTRQILESMADTVDLRDPYTGGHSRRVNEYCGWILDELGIQGVDADIILAAARVHDIGKIGIPDEVLKKTTAFTAADYTIMQTHVELGAELLQRFPDFAEGREIVLHHHEHWDGTGYPHRLHDTEIPFGARVIAVADSFDAMTSNRPYRPSMSIKSAASILYEGRAKQWDAAIVDAFLQRLAESLGETLADSATPLPLAAPPIREHADPLQKL